MKTKAKTIMLSLALVAGNANADLRMEASAGKCQHHLAPDASWHYEYGGIYQEKMQLNPHCLQLGLLWMPTKHYGVRAAYVDLGAVTADNTYPQDEAAYFAAKNSVTAPPPADGRFQGIGNSKGVTFGPVIEARGVSAEAGVATLYNTWHAWVEGFPTWNYADGWNATWYAGAGVRWKFLTVNVRRYANVHASQAAKNYQYIGPTSGPLLQVTVGLSVPLGH